MLVELLLRPPPPGSTQYYSIERRKFTTLLELRDALQEASKMAGVPAVGCSPKGTRIVWQTFSSCLGNSTFVKIGPSFDYSYVSNDHGFRDVTDVSVKWNREESFHENWWCDARENDGSTCEGSKERAYEILDLLAKQEGVTRDELAKTFKLRIY